MRVQVIKSSPVVIIQVNILAGGVLAALLAYSEEDRVILDLRTAQTRRGVWIIVLFLNE